MRALGAAFLLGSLFGTGFAHVLAVLTTPPNSVVDPDRVAPSVLAVDPEPGSDLAAGPRTFRISFDEDLRAAPSVVLAGRTNLTANEESFDGRTWRGAFELLPGADGPCVLHASGVEDLSGNRQGDLMFAYAIDTTPPTSQAFVAANTTTIPFDVTWDATDGNGSGVVRVEVWIRADAGTWSLLTTSSEDRGAHHFDPGARKAVFDLYALAVDGAGNREAVPATPDASVAYDASPPSASLLPVAGYWFRAPIPLAATVSETVTSVDLRFHFAPDNETWQGPFSAGIDSAPWGWTFPWPLGPGHYRMYARARDGEGTHEREQPPGSAELAVGFDAAAATSRVQPAGTYWHAETLAVSANASDDRSGLARVELHYAYRANESVPWSPWKLSASRGDVPWTFPFDFPEGDGRYELATRATDRAGNPEALPPLGEGEIEIGYDRLPPAVPTLNVPLFINAANETTNLTWTLAPTSDLARLEIHRGASPSFLPDGAPCAISTTCVADLPRQARTAWAPVPDTNATTWFRVRAVDAGGLTADSAPIGANLHGLGYDTPNVIGSAIVLPLALAWSERLQYAGGCPDCADAFKVALNATDRLAVILAVPATGDFRLVLYDGTGTFVASSARAGLGAWESLAFEVVIPGTYYIVVDWGGVPGPGLRNEGWYTLSARVS